jgi:excisionase family DNA binding protein
MSDDDDNVRAEQARRGSPFLNTAQAAHYVGLSRRTLEKMRLEARGPAFRKHGRIVRYHIADLDAWSKGRTPKATSDA